MTSPQTAAASLSQKSQGTVPQPELQPLISLPPVLRYRFPSNLPSRQRLLLLRLTRVLAWRFHF
jgi:hypothetical protein